MAVSLPTFNLQANFWYVFQTPAGDPPAVTDLDVQKYILSKFSLEITPGSFYQWTPPIVLRMRIEDWTTWAEFAICEVPAASGSYYLARFKEVVHQGFPNEYLMAIIEQCNAEGEPELRYINIPE